MGHLTTRDAYKNLEERINWFTQGAPPSETLYKILQVLYTEKEAKWVASSAGPSFYAEAGGADLGDHRGKGREAVRPSLRQGAAGGFGLSWGASVCDAAAHGRIY